MGLDWFVEPKTENGRKIEPSETAGLQYLDRDDADSVEKFRQIYEANRAEHEDPGPEPTPEPKPGGLKGLLDGFNRAGRERRYRNDLAWQRWEAKKRRHDHWNRPFEMVLDETLNRERRFVVQYAASDRQDALAKFLGTGDVYDFRAEELLEYRNAVGNFAYNEEGEFWPMELMGDETKPPEEMLKLASEIEASLRAFREAGRDKAGEDEDQEQIDLDIEIAEAAIPWLRFWATHGHSIMPDY